MAILNDEETKALADLCDAILQRDASKLDRVLAVQAAPQGCIGVLALEKLCPVRWHGKMDEDFHSAFTKIHPKWDGKLEELRESGLPSLDAWRPMFPALWGHVDSPAKASATLGLLKVLHVHGWRANIDDLNVNWNIMASLLFDISLMEFVIENDLWTRSGGLPVRLVSNALKPQGERELAMVDALVAKGVWRQEPDPCRANEEGVLALLDEGLGRCAMRLMERGIRPRSCEGSSRVASAWGAIGACLNANIANTDRRANASGSKDDRSVDQKTLLDAMLSNGCSLAGKGEDPCWALIDQVRWGWSGLRDGKDHPMTLECIDLLVGAGADPKKSGRFMGEAVARLEHVGFDLAMFDKAIALGCLDQASFGYALSAPARWDIKGADKAAKIARSKVWFDKLCALGADPALLPKSCLIAQHPEAYAIERSSYAYANHALDKGVAPDWIDSESGSSALHMLAGKESAEPRSLLSRLLADPRMATLIGRPNSKGETALMSACKAMDEAMVQALIAAGADLDARDAKGKFALMHAGLKHGQKADQSANGIVAKLLAAGADPSLVDSKGRTAAQAMAGSAPLDALDTVLRVLPQDLSSDTEHGAQAMQAAAKRGSKALSLVETVLLDSQKATGAKPEAPKRKKSL